VAESEKTSSPDNATTPDSAKRDGVTPVVDQLLTCEAVAGDKRFAQRLSSILEFTQLLYDDDENLTRVGNLSGVAKEKLQTRALEVFDMVDDKPDNPDLADSEETQPPDSAAEEAE